MHHTSSKKRNWKNRIRREAGNRILRAPTLPVKTFRRQRPDLGRKSRQSHDKSTSFKVGKGRIIICYIILGSMDLTREDIEK